MKGKMDMKSDKPVTLLIISMIIGVLLIIVFSIYDIKMLIETKDYMETIGVFIGTTSAGTSSEGTQMYYLNYEYSVENNTYYYTTDYSTSMVPKIGSEKTIKYDLENPSEAYTQGFSNFTIFQIIGTFFFFISLAMLCNKEITRNISIFIWAILIISYSIYGEFYNNWSGVFFIIIPSIMAFACIMFFIEYIKNNGKKRHGIIKENIIQADEYERIINDKNNKEKRTNLEKNRVKNKKKIKVILLSIVLFSLLPLHTFITSMGWFPNETIYMISSVILAFSIFAGFCIIVIYSIGDKEGKKIVSVGGIEVKNDYIEECNTEHVQKDISELKRNVLVSFFKSSIVLPFFALIIYLTKDSSSADKAGTYLSIFFFTIIIYLPVMFHFFKYMKIKHTIKNDGKN